MMKNRIMYIKNKANGLTGPARRCLRTAHSSVAYRQRQAHCPNKGNSAMNPVPSLRHGIVALTALSFWGLVPAGTSNDIDFFTLAAIENFRSDQQWCAENYPEFRSKNKAIFDLSVFAQTTGEAFIEANAPPDQQQRLLGALLQMRSDRKLEYSKMPAKFLNNMCSAFDAHLGKENMRATAERPGKETSAR